MSRAAAQAILTMQRFKPQELANTLWSFATLEHDPPPQLLDAMAFQIVTKIQGFRPQVQHSPCALHTHACRAFHAVNTC